MRARHPHHGSRTPALLGGVVAVAAVALFALSPPARAGDTSEVPVWPSVPSVSDGSPTPSEQALHRVHSGGAGAAVRLTHPDGCLPASAQPDAAARCDGRPGDLLDAAPPTSGPLLRILFCTWLN